MTDVIVVGGGVIGLSIAYSCAHAGMKVILLERGRLGAEASGSTTGLLTAVAEGALSGPYLHMSLAGRALLSEWVRTIEAESGITADLTQTPLLRPAVTDAEAHVLKEWFNSRASPSPEDRLVTGAEVRELEPGLGDGIDSAVYSPHEYHLNPRRLVLGLAAAIEHRGGRIVEGVEVTGLLAERGRVKGVRTSSGRLPGGHVVLATGAWALLCGNWLRVGIPVFPLNGQIMGVKVRTHRLRSIVVTAGGYLIPKPDGTCVVGATYERAGFNARVTPEGLAYLAGIAQLAPGVRSAAFDYAWAGLRPGSPDGEPILGPVPGWEGISLATGHTRHGVLLSGITARMLTAHILGKPDELSLDAFNLARFAQPTAASGAGD